MDVEWWKSFFELGGVILLFLTFAFGAGFMFTGKRVNERQAERLQEFDKNLTDAKIELGKQQERAAKAEGSIALAEQHSAEANAKAEGFRLDIAQANERAASANEIAEKERLARLQLEASLADRVITPDGQAKLASLTKEFPDSVHLDVCAFGGTLEVANITRAIIEPLNGWTIRLWRLTGGAAARGVMIGTSPSATETDRKAAQRLVEVLHSAGIDVGNWGYDELIKAANSGIRNGPGGAVDAPILMVIGTKR
jgi:hypothetical protein